MLNEKVFATYPMWPGEGWVLTQFSCSSRAWTFACAVSSQRTQFQEGSMWQDEVLSIVEEGAECTVTCGRQDGTIYQESINLDEWYGSSSIVG